MFEERDDAPEPPAPAAAHRSNGRNSLEVFDFGLLLQALAQSLKVGTLRVHGAQGEKYVCFDCGRVTGVCTRKSRTRIGHILYRMRVLSKADLRRMVEFQESGKSSLPLGELLLAMRMVSEEDLAAAVRYQMTEELLEIFYWKDYSYEFFAGPMEESLRKVREEFVRVGGSQDVSELLLNVSRLIDDIARFEQYTPSVRDIYEVMTDPEEYLERIGRPPEMTELFHLLDGRRDVREILRDIRLNRFDTMGLLCRLCVDGLIRPKNSFELFMLAENLRNELQPSKLARIYERVRELGVEGFDVSHRLAEVYERMERPEKAAEHYGEHARSAYASGSLEVALDSARRAVRLQPESIAAREFLIRLLASAEERGELAEQLGGLAALHRAEGRHEGERELLERALDLDPDEPSLLLAHADCCRTLKSFSAAGTSLFRLARCRNEAGDLAGAEQALREAVRIAPVDVRLRNALVGLLVERERWDEASEQARRLVAILADAAQRRERGADRRLAACARRLSELGLEDPVTAVAMGEALAEAGAPAPALDLLSSVARRELAAGRFDDARALLVRAVDLAPEDAALREELAWALENLGAADAALAHLRKLGQLYCRAGEPGEAERVYHRMLELRPIAPDTLEELAEVLAEQGRRVEAASLLARVGELHRAAGQQARASEYFDRACRLDPEEPAHLRALAETLSEVLEVKRSSESWERLTELLRERGEHAAALDAGLRLLRSGGGTRDLRPALEACWRELGEKLRAV